jgi:hypothetical protein
MSETGVTSKDQRAYERKRWPNELRWQNYYGWLRQLYIIDEKELINETVIA